MRAAHLLGWMLAVLAAACGSDSGDPCPVAQRQVESCLDELCTDGGAPFCACHLAGQHLVAAAGTCECRDGTVWEAMRPSVCDELDGEPELDCAGLQATIRRYELVGGCL